MSGSRKTAPVLLLLGCLVALPGTAEEQPQLATPASDRRTTTLRAQSELVLIDVVVRHHREPVKGLTKSDFVLFEDGEPEPIAFFEAHERSKVSPAPVAASSPDYFSNALATTLASLNVILFDTLNTPIVDQPYARAQMIQFLKTLPPGYNVALFELGPRLRMLTQYSEASERVVAAAEKLLPHEAPWLETDQESRDNESRMASLAQGMRQYDPTFFDAMNDFMAQSSIAIRENRLRLTLEELSELTGAMSGFHGRKNVIWLSEYFPVSFGLVSDNGHFSNLRRYDDLVRNTASTLSSSQVALYPIDVRGLTSGFLGTATLEGGPANDVSAITNLEARHMGMDEIAEQTGGHAYYNTNDLKDAMQRSLESGSEYYTLAYVPPHAPDSQFHRVKVHLTRSGLRAEYRSGYFAMPVRQSIDIVAQFSGAVQPATPVSNNLHLKAKLQLPDKRHATTRIDCTISPEDLTFLDQPNNRKLARFSLLTVAWDNYLRNVASISNDVELRFSPEQYARVLRDGITVRQQLRLTKPGKYDVRLAVMNDSNNRIGSLEIPVEIDSDHKLAKR